MTKFFARLLCVLLTLQGYPLMALQESGVRAEPVVPPLVDDLDGWAQGIDLPELLSPAWDASVRAGSSLAARLAVHAPRLIVPFLAAVPAHSGEAASEQPAAPPSPPTFLETEIDHVALPPPAELATKSALEEIALAPGWNLVSVPEEPSDADPAAVLSAIGGAYTHAIAYDGCDPADPWKLWDPSDPASSDLTEIDSRTGLWLEASLLVDLPSAGTLPASTSFELCTGWNLIGFPAGQARPVRNALASIDGQYVRVIGYDALDAEDPWESYDVNTPDWANDLETMQPGRGYWILVSEDVTLEIANEGPAPMVALSVPGDLDVVTSPTDVIGSVTSPILQKWMLSYRAVGDEEWIRIASEAVPVADGTLGVFDPTMLLNGLYEIRLEAADYKNRIISERMAVVVEGQQKIGIFRLSFVDLVIPVSGLDIEVVRTYDSRDTQNRDFGVGWTLDIHEGSYHNNRPPGEGWQIHPGTLPCQNVLETRSHLTTVRLSDTELYHFKLALSDTAPTIGGCFARARFDFIDGLQSGATLEALGNTTVFYENNTDVVVDSESFVPYEPETVRLTTRDGRKFDLNITEGITKLQELNGNALQITHSNIAHSSGRAIQFERDDADRIVRIQDALGNSLNYTYDASGDLVSLIDQQGNVTIFSYDDEHNLEEIIDPRGVRAVRNEYSDDGRLAALIPIPTTRATTFWRSPTPWGKQLR